MPACFKNKCDIQDIMNSAECDSLYAIVKAFVLIECSQDSRGYDSAINRLADESGLSNLPLETIMQMKRIIKTFREQKHDK